MTDDRRSVGYICPETMRRERIILPECYIADEPQVFLLMLIDFVRPNTDICWSCKRRALESLVKNASMDAYWTTIPHVVHPGRVRPVKDRLEAKLANMAITAESDWGLSMSAEQLQVLFEPEARKLALISLFWEDLMSGARDLCSAPWTQHNLNDSRDSSGRIPRPSGLGEKLRFMLYPTFGLKDCSTFHLPGAPQGHIDGFVHITNRVLSRSAESRTDCSCSIFDVLYGKHPDEISPFVWPSVVLKAVRQRIDPKILQGWEEYNPLNPFTDEYHFPFRPHRWVEWAQHWKLKYPGLSITAPSGSAAPDYNPDISIKPEKRNDGEFGAREFVVDCFMVTEVYPEWDGFIKSVQFDCLSVMGRLQWQDTEELIMAQQKAHDQPLEEFASLYTGMDMCRQFTTSTTMTLRHCMNNPFLPWHQCTDDGTEPIEYPDRWMRYV